MIDLFEALADLFQGQCKTQGIEILDDDGNYTRVFWKWTTKLFEAGITREDMRRGLTHLEEAKRDSVRSGNGFWPPDFSSFIGHCKAQKERVPMYQRLPPATMSNEDKKEKMKGVIDSVPGKKWSI